MDPFVLVLVLFESLLAAIGITSGQTKLNSLPEACAAANVTEQHISREVFSQLENWARPIRNVGEPTVVTLELALSSIFDVVEVHRVLSLTGFVTVRWFDEFHTWNTTFPLNCIPYVVVPASEVWLPDIALMNTKSRYSLMSQTGEKVRIYSDGFSIYSPGGNIDVDCNFDCTYFPFDEQRCVIILESWRYTRSMMQFRFYAENVMTFQWSENTQWRLVNMTHALKDLTYFDPENNFDRAEFYVHLKRKSAYYVTRVIVPCAVIVIAQFSIFALAVHEVQKLSILFTFLLSFLVFQVTVANDLPKSSDNVPLFVLYLDLIMALISSSILGECAVFALLRRANTLHPNGPGFVGPWLQRFIIFANNCLRLNYHFPLMTTEAISTTTTTTKKNTDKKEEIVDLEPAADYSVSSNNKSPNPPVTVVESTASIIRQTTNDIAIAKQQWQVVANVIDHLTMTIYMAANVLLPIVLFLIYPQLR